MTDAAHIPVRGPSRLATLRRLVLLDAAEEHGFDRLARLASKILDRLHALLIGSC